MNCKKCGEILKENELCCPICGRPNYLLLVEQAKQGNEEAIRVLYEHSNKKNYYEALKIVHDQGVAEDLVQESIIKSYKRLDQLEDPEKFESWFTRIVVNECKNYIKPMKNNELSFTSVEDDEEYTFENNIEDEKVAFSPKENFDYSELKDGLNQVLDELPFEQKMSVILTYLNGYKIKEVAEILEIPENTVKTCQLKGKAAIKKKIEELRKQNKSFYSIAPIPFLVWMLTEDAKAMEMPAMVMPTATVAGTATATASGAAKAAGSTAAKTTVKAGFMHTVAGKAAVGCLCALVAGGGIVTAVSHFGDDAPSHNDKVAEKKEEWVPVKDEEFPELMQSGFTKSDIEYILDTLNDAMIFTTGFGGEYDHSDRVIEGDFENAYFNTFRRDEIYEFDSNGNANLKRYLLMLQAYFLDYNLDDDGQYLHDNKVQYYSNPCLLDEYKGKTVEANIHPEYSLKEWKRYLSFVTDYTSEDDMYFLDYNREKGTFRFSSPQVRSIPGGMKITKTERNKNTIRIYYTLNEEKETIFMDPTQTYKGRPFKMKATLILNENNKFELEKIEDISLKDKKEEEPKKDESLSDDYIFPTSNSEYLTRKDLNGVSAQKLNYGKNEIFARHGRRFNSAELQNYFDSRSWYEGTISPNAFNTNVLNDYELKNMELITKVENEKAPGGYQLD